MKKILVLDPSSGTRNIGDDIIFDAVKSQIERLFPLSFYYRISTHEFMLSTDTREILRECDLIFVGGSNLLKSKMEWNTQWKLTPLDLFKLRNAILLGCGWRHYSTRPTPYTSFLYRTVLHRTRLHSARDQMTKTMLEAAGLTNVVNTSCVTMWDLDEDRCRRIKPTKAQNAVITVTAYNPDRQNDQIFIEAALKNYETTFLLVQSPDDLPYAQSLAGGRLTLISPTLEGYDRLLEQDVDYLGTRLHGGIRALQKGKRTLILAIDNRAREICSDTGLPVIDRSKATSVEDWINQPATTNITLPSEAISAWRTQFLDVAHVKP